MSSTLLLEIFCVFPSFVLEGWFVLCSYAFFPLVWLFSNAGRFLLCSVTDGEGKKHWLVFPKGRSFLNGWTMLTKKISGMGFKPQQENIPMKIATVDPSKGGESLSKNIVTWGGQPALKDVDEGGSSVKNAVWVDVGDCVYGKELGSLQFCLIGRWKTKPESYPMSEELEVWFREAWRLNEEVKLVVLNEDLLILEFNSPEKASGSLSQEEEASKEACYNWIDGAQNLGV